MSDLSDDDDLPSPSEFIDVDKEDEGTLLSSHLENESALENYDVSLADISEIVEKRNIHVEVERVLSETLVQQDDSIVLSIINDDSVSGCDEKTEEEFHTLRKPDIFLPYQSTCGAETFLALEHCGYKDSSQLTPFELHLYRVPSDLLIKKLSLCLAMCHPSNISCHHSFVCFLLRNIAANSHIPSVHAAKRTLEHMIRCNDFKSAIHIEDLLDTFLRLGFNLSACPVQPESIPLMHKLSFKNQSYHYSWSRNNQHAFFSTFCDIIERCHFSDDILTELVILLLCMGLDSSLSVEPEILLLIQRCISYALEKFSELGWNSRKLIDAILEFAPSNHTCGNYGIFLYVIWLIPVETKKGRLLQKTVAYKALCIALGVEEMSRKPCSASSLLEILKVLIKTASGYPQSFVFVCGQLMDFCIGYSEEVVSQAACDEFRIAVKKFINLHLRNQKMNKSRAPVDVLDKAKTFNQKVTLLFLELEERARSMFIPLPIQNLCDLHLNEDDDDDVQKDFTPAEDVAVDHTGITKETRPVSTRNDDGYEDSELSSSDRQDSSDDESEIRPVRLCKKNSAIGWNESDDENVEQSSFVHEVSLPTYETTDEMQVESISSLRSVNLHSEHSMKKIKVEKGTPVKLEEKETAAKFNLYSGTTGNSCWEDSAMMLVKSEPETAVTQKAASSHNDCDVVKNHGNVEPDSPHVAKHKLEPSESGLSCIAMKSPKLEESSTGVNDYFGGRYVQERIKNPCVVPLFCEKIPKSDVADHNSLSVSIQKNNHSPAKSEVSSGTESYKESQPGLHSLKHSKVRGALKMPVSLILDDESSVDRVKSLHVEQLRQTDNVTQPVCLRNGDSFVDKNAGINETVTRVLYSADMSKVRMIETSTCVPNKTSFKTAATDETRKVALGTSPVTFLENGVQAAQLTSERDVSCEEISDIQPQALPDSSTSLDRAKSPSEPSVQKVGDHESVGALGFKDKNHTEPLEVPTLRNIGVRARICMTPDCQDKGLGHYGKLNKPKETSLSPEAGAIHCTNVSLDVPPSVQINTNKEVESALIDKISTCKTVQRSNTVDRDKSLVNCSAYGLSALYDSVFPQPNLSSTISSKSNYSSLLPRKTHSSRNPRQTEPYQKHNNLVLIDLTSPEKEPVPSLPSSACRRPSHPGNNQRFSELSQNDGDRSRGHASHVPVRTDSGPSCRSPSSISFAPNHSAGLNASMVDASRTPKNIHRDVEVVEIESSEEENGDSDIDFLYETTQNDVIIVE